MANERLIFVNLPTRDLPRIKTFFEKLGFEFNAKFTDEKAACMVVSDKAFVMWLTEPFFKTFTNNAIADTSKQTEALICLSCASRAAVDELVKKAVELGGRPAMPAQDHGYMYGWSFYDPEGHHWEVMWMDPTVAGQ